ncbi:MAG TPA: hypothetical protein ENJ95_23925 [Bacteroidetes bacterium]|nr:hypothetical protein [Bacteroidota bacterium]
MVNSKVISLLRSFSAAEWKSFGKYLHSPYLNSNKRLCAFYAFLKKHHPAFGHAKLAKPIVFAALFPNKEIFDDRLVRVVMADLHRAAESFLVFEQLKKDRRSRSKMLIRSYGGRGLYDRFERHTNDLLEDIDLLPSKSMADYLDAFLLNQEHYFHPRTEALTTNADSLKNAVRRLDSFYALAKLRLSCELSARTKIVAEEAIYPLLDPVCGYIEKHLLDKDPAFGIYLDLLKINREGLTGELFFGLKNKYLASRERLSFLEQKEVLIYLLNYAYQLALSADRSFFYEQLELYKIGLANGLLLDNGILPDIRFTNIAAVGSTVKKWKWTKNFIHSYSSLLPEDIAQDAIFLAESYLHFHRGNFLETDRIVNKISTNNVSYKFRQYSLSIRSLFEITLVHIDYIELLLSRIYAYEKYLSRQKTFSKKRNSAEINFTKLVKKISSCLANKNITLEQWEQMKIETEKTTPLAAKSWLLEKISKNLGRDRQKPVPR